MIDYCIEIGGWCNVFGVVHTDFIGREIEFQDEGKGKITAENEDSIYIESDFFTGWMFKSEYYDLLGVED